MKQADIRIIRAELSNITNEKTGEVKDMTKIIYSIRMTNTDRTIGLTVLEGYKMGNHLEKLDKLIDQKVKADIEERPTKNGSKYVLMKINGTEL